MLFIKVIKDTGPTPKEFTLSVKQHNTISRVSQTAAWHHPEQPQQGLAAGGEEEVANATDEQSLGVREGFTWGFRFSETLKGKRVCF